MTLAVSLATDSDEHAWSDYSHRAAHHAHAWAWRDIISATFDHTPYYYICRDSASSVCGILPLFLVKSVLFGKALISLPYLNGGGIVSENDEAACALLEEATRLARELKVDYLELRHRGPLSLPSHPLTERQHKVAMLLPLLNNPDEMFARFPAKLRSQIKRAERENMAVRSCNGTDADIDAFYRVFSEHMRDLGTPVYPRLLFSAVCKHFASSVRMIVLSINQEPISVCLTIRQGDMVEIPWAASLKRFHHVSPNMLLYWEAIKIACLDGATHFDFGRSSYDSGTYRFKEQWGTTPLPLHWHYIADSQLPDVNPHNPKFAFFVSCWKHLPLTVANFIGPQISKSLP